HETPADELWGLWLATPQLREVSTDASWSPEVVCDDYSPSSLRDLGDNSQRNEKIIGELLEGRRAGRYRRTLVFACDVKHAEELNRLLAEHGIPAGVVHSCMPQEDQVEAFQGFHRGRLGALVNVVMLAEGTDIPTIDSVFLARPTR